MNDLAREEYCYLTTTGRVTGKSHEIEIWFGMKGNTVYLLSGGGHKSDWVKNLIKNPIVTVRIGKRTFSATGRLVQSVEEVFAARTMLADKYNERESDGSLSEWAKSALVVAFELSYTLHGHKLRFLKELEAQGEQRIKIRFVSCPSFAQAL